MGDHQVAAHDQLMTLHIRVLPGPLWEALRLKRDDAAAPAEFVPAREVDR